MKYEVKEKKSHKTTIKAIADYIKSKHLNHTGIIYCGTQNMCEKVCKDLQEVLKEIGYDKRSGFYHAGLSDSEREIIQQKWSNDELKIIAATVAVAVNAIKGTLGNRLARILPNSL